VSDGSFGETTAGGFAFEVLAGGAGVDFAGGFAGGFAAGFFALAFEVDDDGDDEVAFEPGAGVAADAAGFAAGFGPGSGLNADGGGFGSRLVGAPDAGGDASAAAARCGRNAAGRAQSKARRRDAFPRIALQFALCGAKVKFSGPSGRGLRP
jgi:hypothetical protein